MRKILLTLAALAAFGIALPVASNTANAETVIIKKNHGWHHHGWRHRNRVVVRETVRHRHHHHRVGAAVVIR